MKHVKTIVFILLLIALILPFSVSAIKLNLTYPILPGALDINCHPGACKQDLDDIIAWFYALIVGISGLAAFIMIVWGGIQYMTSAGNPTKTTDARDKIRMALLGLLLVLASFLILRVINPELTFLRSPG